MSDIYYAVEIYPAVRDRESTIVGDPLHNCIATAEEMATHLSGYRGDVHIITGFYTAEQVAGMTYTERGLAHLDEPDAPPPNMAQVPIMFRPDADLNDYTVQQLADGILWLSAELATREWVK